MVNQLSMYSHSKLDYRQLKRDGSRDDAVRQVEAKADELYSKTLQAIKGYAEMMTVIKTTLLERYVLSKDEVFALLTDLMSKRITTIQPVIAHAMPMLH